jgi:hypothetical protein
MLSFVGVRAVLFSPFCNWLRICVVELLLLSLCVEVELLLYTLKTVILLARRLLFAIQNNHQGNNSIVFFCSCRNQGIHKVRAVIRKLKGKVFFTRYLNKHHAINTYGGVEV